MNQMRWLIVLAFLLVIPPSGVLLAQEAAEGEEVVEPAEGAEAPAEEPEAEDPVAAARAKAKDAAETYNIARRLYRLKKYSEAVSLCEELLKQDPGNNKIEVLMYKAKAAKYERELAGAKLKEEDSHKRAILEIDEATTIPVPREKIPRPVRDDLVIKIKPDLLEEEVREIQEKLNQRVSIDLIDADLSYILNLLFRSCGINIIANQKDLEGHVLTIHVQDFPLKEILKYIARNEGITYTITPEAVWVTTPTSPMLETKAVYLKKGLTDVKEEAESFSSDLEQMIERLPELVDWVDGSAYYLDRKANILYLRSTPEVLSQAVKLVETLDVTPSQVLIESRFVEIGADDLFDLGIDWNFTSPYVITTKGGEAATQITAGSGTDFSTPWVGDANYTGGLGLKYIGILTDPQFQAVLHALSTREDTNTLSAPKLIALNNYTATIEIQEKIIYVESYNITYPSTTIVTGDQDVEGEESRPTVIPILAEEDVGIKLKITPSIGADKEIVTLSIEPVITEQTGEETFEYQYPGAAGEPAETKEFTRPLISTRTLLTKLAIKDGSTIVIGGLMKDQETKITRRVPGLSRIPLIGRLFRRDIRNVEKRNLIIFVTARVLDADGGGYVSRKPSAEENKARYRTIVHSGPGVEVVEERTGGRNERGN